VGQRTGEPHGCFSYLPVRLPVWFACLPACRRNEALCLLAQHTRMQLHHSSMPDPPVPTCRREQPHRCCTAPSPLCSVSLGLALAWCGRRQLNLARTDELSVLLASELFLCTSSFALPVD